MPKIIKNKSFFYASGAENTIISTIPLKTDGADEWLNWYDSMRKSVLGTKKANDLFKYAWTRIQPTTANTTELRTTMAKHGVTVDATNMLGVLADTSVNFFDDIKSVGKFMLIGGGVLIAFGVVVVGVSFLKGNFK